MHSTWSNHSNLHLWIFIAAVVILPHLLLVLTMVICSAWEIFAKGFWDSITFKKEGVRKFFNISWFARHLYFSSTLHVPTANQGGLGSVTLEITSEFMSLDVAPCSLDSLLLLWMSILSVDFGNSGRKLLGGRALGFQFPFVMKLCLPINSIYQ